MSTKKSTKLCQETSETLGIYVVVFSQTHFALAIKIKKKIEWLCNSLNLRFWKVTNMR